MRSRGDLWQRTHLAQHLPSVVSAPRKNGLIKQFPRQTHWGEREAGLFVCLGDQECPMSCCRRFIVCMARALTAPLAVTSPQPSVVADTRRHAGVCRKTQYTVARGCGEQKRDATPALRDAFHARLRRPSRSPGSYLRRPSQRAMNLLGRWSSRVLAVVHAICRAGDGSSPRRSSARSCMIRI